jgi:DNA repair photolyase
MSIGNCKNNCIYCYAKEKEKKQTSLRQIENAINEKYRESLRSYYLENRYPVAICNQSDIFNCEQKDIFTGIKILKDAEFPIFWETKGVHTELQMYQFFEIANKKDIVYLTITSFNDKIRKEIEPIAPSIENRMKFLDELVRRGFFVIVGFNPMIKDFLNENVIIEFIEKYKNYNVNYLFQYMHSFGKKAKELSRYILAEKISLKNIASVLKKWNIAVSGNYIEFIDCISCENKARNHFGKKILISYDLDVSLKKQYELFLPEAVKQNINLKETPVGWMSFNYFYEENKDKFLNCIIDKNEIYSRLLSGQELAALPKKMSYKDYMNMVWCNPKFTSFLSYSKRAYLYDDSGQVLLNDNKEPYYFYNNQEAFKEV